MALIEPAVGQEETEGEIGLSTTVHGATSTGSSATDEKDSLSKARQDSIPRVGILCLGSGLCFCTSSGYVRY